MRVLRRTPSRIGIISSLRVKGGSSVCALRGVKVAKQISASKLQNFVVVLIIRYTLSTGPFRRPRSGEILIACPSPLGWAFAFRAFGANPSLNLSWPPKRPSRFYTGVLAVLEYLRAVDKHILNAD